jgi:hypothetical protein
MNNTWSRQHERRANAILGHLEKGSVLGKYIDQSLPIPQPFRGTGNITLIFLGQDPTVKNVASRKMIKMVLNLDKNNALKRYLTEICDKLGIKLEENVYATNLYKNFFVAPPTQIREIDIFRQCAPHWLPLLLEELSEFEQVPVITLGEPILVPLTFDHASRKVHDYWGYVRNWETRPLPSFRHLKASDNKISRTIFPFPHQPSLRKPFYKTKMDDYVAYVKREIFG